MIIHDPRIAGLIAVALTAVLALEVVPEADPDPTEPMPPAVEAQAPEQSEAPLAAIYSLPEPDRIHHMAERPLFVAGRRPPEPMPEPQKTAKPKPKPAKRPEFVLSAIVREGNRWIAVVGSLDRGAPPPAEVEVGGVVAGWKVERITADDVVLRRGKQQATVSLRHYPDPVPASGNTAVSKTRKRVRRGG